MNTQPEEGPLADLVADLMQPLMAYAALLEKAGNPSQSKLGLGPAGRPLPQAHGPAGAGAAAGPGRGPGNAPLEDVMQEPPP